MSFAYFHELSTIEANARQGDWAADGKTFVFISDRGIECVSAVDRDVPDLHLLLESGKLLDHVACHPQQTSLMAIATFSSVELITSGSDDRKSLPWHSTFGCNVAQFAPDGRYFGVSADEGSAIWEFPNFSENMRTVSGHKWSLLAVGPRDIAAFEEVDDRIVFFDLKRKEPINAVSADCLGLEAAAFSMDGTCFGVGYANGSVEVVDVNSCEKKQTLKREQSGVLDIGFIAADTRMIVLYRDGLACCWDLVSGVPIGHVELGARQISVHRSGAVAALQDGQVTFGHWLSR